MDTRMSGRCLRRCTVVLALVALCYGSDVRADAIDGPPSNCTTGSRGESCHGGQYCSPARCTDDTDCIGGNICEDTRLCIGRIDCASGWTPEGEHYWNDTVEGECPNGDSECSAGSCQLLRVCVDDYEADFTGRYGCGCRLAAPHTAGGAALALLIAAAAALALRRSRGGRPKS